MKYAALAVVLLSSAAFADGNVVTNTPNATAVAVVSQQAGTLCITANAAAAAQATVTSPAGVNGAFFYITLIESTYSAIAAPAATLMATTSTNIPTHCQISG